MLDKLLNEEYSIDSKIIDIVNSASKLVLENSKFLDEIKEYNQYKILAAFKKVGLSQADFAYATGYGYGDRGREKTEEIFSLIFKAEDALVRPAISSGTHALSLTLSGILNKGDKLVAITGHPYDTLQEVIGIKGDSRNSLIKKGIFYDYVDLVDNRFDFENIKTKIEGAKLVTIQRSTGYGERRALTISEIEEAISFVKDNNPDAIVMVDNCYGEFTEKNEPVEVGADLAVGSLIKNPGGGIALGGGYIVGKRLLIEDISERLYAPGIGKETGLTFDTTRSTLQGLFFAPHITIEAMRSALLMCKVFGDMGYQTVPNYQDPRSDIIQSIYFREEQKLIDFVQSIQQAASVGSLVVPYPWDMPGYSNQVIMASGGFVDGSSIEISADGPLREPYIAYFQGGVVYEQGKLACMLALSKFNNIKK